MFQNYLFALNFDFLKQFIEMQSSVRVYVLLNATYLTILYIFEKSLKSLVKTNDKYYRISGVENYSREMEPYNQWFSREPTRIHVTTIISKFTTWV